VFAMLAIPVTRARRIVRLGRATLASAAVALVLVSAMPVAAGQPGTLILNPVPPDTYSCRATGSGATCAASIVEPFELLPSGIFCGSGAGTYEVLDSGTRIVNAKRWYDRNGNLTRRERVTRFSGLHLSNPLNGRSVAYQQHNTDWDVLAVPGDLSTSTFTGHGHLTITVPGVGTVLHEAGRTIVGPDGMVEAQSGPSDLSDYFGGDAAVVAELCAALG
jgi:hypothetical protein